MSGAISATTAIAISAGVAAVGTAASVMASNKQARQQKAAAKEAQRNNEITQTKAREDMRRQNAKEADVSSIYEQNLSGGSTLLTGPEGINNSDLTLGKGNKLGA